MADRERFCRKMKPLIKGPMLRLVRLAEVEALLRKALSSDRSAVFEEIKQDMLHAQRLAKRTVEAGLFP